MKRQKTVFTSKELAHVWANQGAPHGRSPGNMSFDGDAFKSYNAVIARRIRYKGKTAYVKDCAQFSVTTSGHQSCVSGAIRDANKVFLVHAGWNSQGTLGVYDLRFTPATLRDYYLAKYRRKEEKPSRYEFMRAGAFISRIDSLEDAIAVCEYFGLATRKLKLESKKHSKEYARCQKLLADRRDKLNKASEEKRKRENAARISRAIGHAEAIIAGQVGIEEWSSYNDSLLDSRPDLFETIQARRIEKDRADIQAWIDGASDKTSHDWPVFLREEELESTLGEMVTTKGARVPLVDAERTFRFCMKARAKGWHRNGDKHKIGMYELEAVNEYGVVAGCHRIAWPEIERFAKSQGWL